MNPTVLCLQGSLARPSRTATLIELVRRILARSGSCTDLIDVRDIDLPPVDPAHHGEPRRHPDPRIRDLARRVEAADALVWGSPVYHNSYSGALKNVLDHLGATACADKPVALCGNGGRRASPQATDHLRIVARGLHGIALPLGLITADSEFVIDNGRMKINDPGVAARAIAMCDQLIEFASLHRTRRVPAASGE